MSLSDPILSAAVLVFLAGGYLISTLADLLNIRHSSPVVPEEFTDVYETDRYKTAQKYLVSTTKAKIVESSLDLSALLIFWFSGGFGILDLVVREFRQGPVTSGLLYIGALAFLNFLLSLPLRLWHTFVIEEDFGFNKTTLKTFILDLIKTLTLSALLGSVMLSVVLWFFEAGGPMAWLFCWGVTSLFLIGLQYMVPTFIMPLFNRFTPLEDGELNAALFAYARSIDFPLTRIFVMDGSKRSAKSNAFFTGFGRNKRIVLFDTLIQHHTTEELVAVLAHEMGHYKKKHIQNRLILAVCQMGILFFLVSVFIRYPGMFAAFDVAQPSVYAGLVFFSILFSPLDMVISLGLQYLSRKNEIEADQFAACTTQGASALISALKKLSAHNLGNLTPHPFYVWLNYSHPPVLERISRLRQIDEKGCP